MSDVSDDTSQAIQAEQQPAGLLKAKRNFLDHQVKIRWPAGGDWAFHSRQYQARSPFAAERDEAACKLLFEPNGLSSSKLGQRDASKGRGRVALARNRKGWTDKVWQTKLRSMKNLFKDQLLEGADRVSEMTEQRIITFIGNDTHSKSQKNYLTVYIPRHMPNTSQILFHLTQAIYHISKAMGLADKAVAAARQAQLDEWEDI